MNETKTLKVCKFVQVTNGWTDSRAYVYGQSRDNHNFQFDGLPSIEVQFSYVLQVVAVHLCSWVVSDTVYVGKECYPTTQ